jgi:hypothetical protein
MMGAIFTTFGHAPTTQATRKQLGEAVMHLRFEGGGTGFSGGNSLSGAPRRCGVACLRGAHTRPAENPRQLLA